MTDIAATDIRVSVAMTSYNGERYIKEQIDTILNNLSEKDELIISDDGSTDGTLSIIKAYTDTRVKLVAGPCKGVVKNFENALMHCKGQYIFLSDQDDIWMPDKVSTVLPLLETNILVCHNADIYDNNADAVIDTIQNKIGCNGTVLKNVWKNSFIGCCMAFRRELLDRTLPFPDERLIHIHDWWLGLIALKSGPVAFEARSLIRYRIHDSNTLGFHKTTFMFKLKKRINMLKALRKYGKNSKKNH